MRRVLAVILLGSTTLADPPRSAYVFPAGGQRGSTVDVRIGGLNLHETARLHVAGAGVTASDVVERTQTLWFEGPLIRQPASQRGENYPRDYAGRFTIAADAPGTPARWSVSNSQGVTPSRAFVVGDLPEIVEEEIDGDPIPVAVELPVTINGRVFPREDVDVWTFDAEPGETIVCEVNAARLGSPLDSRLEVRGPDGRIVAANVDALGNDSRLRFVARTAGTYACRIHDVAFEGLQDHVYRLTITNEPWVEAVYPLGGRRGETVEVLPVGMDALDHTLRIPIPADAGERFAHRASVDGRPAGTITLDVGEHPERLERVDDEPAEFEIPATLNGRIESPGDTDDWTFVGGKGTKLAFDVRAAALGSPVDSVLTLFDEAGKEIASNDDRRAQDSDSLLDVTLPADGRYTLRIADRLTSRGGERFAYRIVAAEPSSEFGFRVSMPLDALTVTRGVETKVELLAVRVGGFEGEITIRVDGLPEGVTAEGTIPAKKPKGTLVLRAADDVPVRVDDVQLIAVGTIAAAPFEVPVTATGPSGESIETVRLAVAIPTPFSFAADFETKYANMGCVHERRYRLERKGYDGPLAVRLADVQARHLQGVTGPTVDVPAGATSFDYPVQLGPRMEVGRTSRSCVLAVANVTDFDGSEHTVCFGSTAQNEQFVLLTDPPRLHVAAERESIVAEPNSTLRLQVRVERANGLDAPVTVTGRTAAHVGDVACSEIVVPTGAEEGELTLDFGEAPGPFNVPLVLRATTADERGHPIVAESTITVVPAEGP